MKPYNPKDSGCWYSTISFFNLSEHDEICEEDVRIHTHTRTYNKADVANSKSVVVSDEKVGIVMGDEAMKEAGRADEVDVEDAECIGKLKERMEGISDFRDQLDMKGGQQGI